jgi:putative ABC transport system permease protein
VVRGAIAARWGAAHQLVIVDNADLRREIVGRLRGAFMPTAALFVLAVIIGCLGIANSLYIAVSERVREIGILRSLGLRRREIVRLVVAEAGALGLLGALLGVGLGALLSYLWVALHVRHTLGWVIEYHFAVGGTLVGIAAALVTAPLAGWRPARQAARTPPIAALAHE